MECSNVKCPRHPIRCPRSDPWVGCTHPPFVVGLDSYGLPLMCVGLAAGSDFNAQLQLYGPAGVGEREHGGPPA